MGLFPKDRDLTRPLREVELRVDASDLRMRVEEVDLRLDAFLGRHLHWRSRNSIQELIRSGHVLLDASTPEHPEGRGERVVELRPGRRLRHGARVVVVIPEHLRLPTTGPASDELTILYEDEAVIAVDKPPFLVVHPGGRHLVDTLIQRVHARFGGRAELEKGWSAPRLCHRLDRETSGVVLVGRNLDAHSFVRKQFERHAIGKEYLAIVAGEPEADEGVIDLPIGSSRTSRVGLKMTTRPDGQASRTEWRVLERHGECALLSCVPRTGRQHQIRVHLAAIGHPVVGDKLYGPDETVFERDLEGHLTREDLVALGLPRHALHNHRVAFVTPASGSRIEVESPLPTDLVAYLEAIQSPMRGGS